MKENATVENTKFNWKWWKMIKILRKVLEKVHRQKHLKKAGKTQKRLTYQKLQDLLVYGWHYSNAQQYYQITLVITSKTLPMQQLLLNFHQSNN